MAPAAIKPIPISKLPAIHSSIPIATVASPVTAPKSCKNLVTIFFDVPKFITAVAANPIAPTIINPIPSGKLPVTTSINPIPNIAPLTIEAIASNIPDIDLVIAPQLRATAVANATAPATNKATPNGICPAIIIIIPNARRAPATIITIDASIDLICCDIASPQFIAAAATNMVIPATIAAIPKGINPASSNITPITSNAPPTTVANITNAFDKSPFSLFQLIATAATTSDAPNIINAIPNGTLPVSTNITPSTKKKPPSKPSI